MWFDPQQTGLYLGQCAQYCGTHMPRMLLRVYVQSGDAFNRWIEEQVSRRTRVPQFLKAAHFRDDCCHQLHACRHGGRRAFGPDLTHLMSRETIAPERRRTRPKISSFGFQIPTPQPGSKMPAMD